MPHSDLHKKKRTKNLVLLGAILAWIAVIFCVTIIRIKSGG